MYKYENLKYEEPVFLEKADKSGYVCPCCSSGSGPHGTGLIKNKETERWKCFSCGFYGSTVDLYMKHAGIDDYKQACKDLIALYKIDEEHDKTIIFPKQTVKSSKTIPNYVNYYKQAMANNDYKYLESRGISAETQRKFWIGYDPHWKPEKVKNIYSPRCIIPRSTSCYLARDVRENSNPAYIKQVEGRFQYPFNHKAIDKHSTIFVVEGEIDAMSIEEVGGHAVGLCGIGNTKIFLDYAKSHNNGQNYFVMLDSDERGQKAQFELLEKMNAAGLNAIGIVIPVSLGKDPNELLMKYPEILRTAVSNSNTIHLKKNSHEKQI